MTSLRSGVRMGLMKKLSLYLFLGLLLSGNAYAEHSLSLESVLPNPKCDGVKLSLWHYRDTYTVYVKNPTKVTIKINFVKFLTRDDDIITTVKVSKVYSPFHKGKIEIKRPNIMHELVKKISIDCDA